MVGPIRDEAQVAQQDLSRSQSPPLAGRLMKQAVGVPSGPLGWVFTRTLFSRVAGPTYKNMAEALRLGSDDELLEVACGSGTFLVRHASHARSVAGIDLSDLQIDLARRNLEDRIAAGTAEIVKGDAATLPWPEDSFTVVTCMGSFEVFPDPQQVLAEMFRVLRPGGRAVMNIGERVPVGTQTEWRWGVEWVWAEDDVPRMVEQAGFTDVTMEYAAAWGDDPLSQILVKLGQLMGSDTSELRIISARKE